MDNVSMFHGKQAQCNGKCISNFKSRKRLFIYKRHIIYSIDHPQINFTTESGKKKKKKFTPQKSSPNGNFSLLALTLSTNQSMINY